MGQLEGKICLITGASRGIGAAAAQRFAEEGAIVYAAARSVEETRKWVGETGMDGKVIPIAMDLKNPAGIKAGLTQVRREQGRLDVLVNNAAIEKNERIGMIARSTIESMFETNVYGAIEILQFASRLMQRSGGGSIINVASRVGERGNAGQLVYSATKGAIVAMTYSAAKELAEFGIRVNAVSPGLTNTEMFHAVNTDQLESRLKNICMGRPAEPVEIADAMVFLASNNSRFISGHVLHVDGCTII